MCRYILQTNTPPPPPSFFKKLNALTILDAFFRDICNIPCLNLEQLKLQIAILNLINEVPKQHGSHKSTNKHIHRQGRHD